MVRCKLMNIPDPITCPTSAPNTDIAESDEWKAALKDAATTELQKCYGQAINFDHLLRAYDTFDEMGRACKFWSEVYLTCARLVGKYQSLHSAAMALADEMGEAKKKGQTEEPAPMAPA